eukprot:comp19872_c0_seq1/m.38565 comp19872_c0_seq1/g.38565  ORF comp19872_c0_seq1/g.38565 comp19872_c0_seq1/m.38565 type:complete len:457 (-) comp19872_c0_seq1:45-1415(-)
MEANILKLLVKFMVLHKHGLLDSSAMTKARPILIALCRMTVNADGAPDLFSASEFSQIILDFKKHATIVLSAHVTGNTILKMDKLFEFLADPKRINRLFGYPGPEREVICSSVRSVLPELEAREETEKEPEDKNARAPSKAMKLLGLGGINNASSALSATSSSGSLASTSSSNQLPSDQGSSMQLPSVSARRSSTLAVPNPASQEPEFSRDELDILIDDDDDDDDNDADDNDNDNGGDGNHYGKNSAHNNNNRNRNRNVPGADASSSSDESERSVKRMPNHETARQPQPPPSQQQQAGGMQSRVPMPPITPKQPHAPARPAAPRSGGASRPIPRASVPQPPTSSSHQPQPHVPSAPAPPKNQPSLQQQLQQASATAASEGPTGKKKLVTMLVLQQRQFSDFGIWNPWTTYKKPDFDKDDYKHVLGLLSCHAFSPISLGKGAVWTGKQTLMFELNQS